MKRVLNIIKSLVYFNVSILSTQQLHGQYNSPDYVYNNYDPYYQQNYNNPPQGNPYDSVPATYSDAQVVNYGGDTYPNNNVPSTNYQAAGNNYNSAPSTKSHFYWENSEIVYQFAEVYYERMFFNESRLLESGNGVGGRVLIPLAKGFFLEIGGSYGKADFKTDATQDQLQALYAVDAAGTDTSMDITRARIGGGAFWPIVQNVHILAKGGIYYSNYSIELAETSELLDGVGWYVGPELRILSLGRVELDFEALYSKIKANGQVSFGAGLTFHLSDKIGLGAKYKILDDDSTLGVGMRFNWQ